jgi:hypothetical protein
MDTQETNSSNAQHLEKVRADIESDQAKMDELRKRIKGRTILGFSLPGTEALKEDLRKTELAWRFSVAEESSTMTEVTQDNIDRALADESAENDTDTPSEVPETPDVPDTKQ